MNPHHTSNQNPATASAVQQVNTVTSQQPSNGNIGGMYPNNRPPVPPSGFMNFPNQPFPMQNTPAQFPMGMVGFNPQQNFNPFPVNQFNPSQPHPQLFPNNSMNRPVYNQNVGLPNEQVIMQNTIQNIYQLLQLQNANYPQCPPGNFPMFQNQMAGVMNHQNPGFLANQQFGMPNFSVPLQLANNQGQQLPNMGQQLQGNPFLQNQIAQGGVPQNHNFLPNQPSGMANMSGPLQQANQGQQGFVPPLMGVNASRQIPNTGQQGSSVLPQNPHPPVTNFQDNYGNVPQGKNFTGDRKNDGSHKGFSKSHFHHAKHGFNGNMNKEGKYNAAVNSSPKNSIKFEKRVVPSLKYTDQEIKQWREARKKHYPTSVPVEKNCKKEETLADVTNQESLLRREQLKEILAKQAELGCEVADIPSYYLSSPQKQIQKTEKYEKGQRFKKGKFHNKRGSPFQKDRTAKKTRQENQDYRAHNPKRDPSLLQKLLTRDIKRDQNHLLQVFRFMAVNSFFSGDPDTSLRFPVVVVRETMGVEVAGEPPCAVVDGGEKAAVEKVDVESDEEEGEITD